MKQYLNVFEGNTGILYLKKNQGKETKYIPDCNLEKTRQLLLEFQELKCVNGKSLKNNYNSDGYNWYPSMVSFLYWHFFFPYIKYQTLMHDILDNKFIVSFSNKAEFYNLYQILTKDACQFRFKNLLFFSLLHINNKLVIKRFPFQMMFSRFSFNDFRSIEIRNELDNLGIRYIQVIPPGRIKEIIKYFIKKKPYYYYGGFTKKKLFKFEYNLDDLDSYKKKLFLQGIDHLERTLSYSITEFKLHDKLLRNSCIKILYGFDDCNEYIFPLLYALKNNGIYTIAHQHGAYVRRHAGYIMEGIDINDYQWFDKVIVWGNYWKNQLLKHSSVYTYENLVIGSNKFKIKLLVKSDTNREPKNILIPYEFVGNTYKIGRFIERFIALGFNVYFKTRPDEKIQDQLGAYCLSKEIEEKIIITEELDVSLINKIDIIAGTMTTLVYELLPYNKIIWILDTEYKHLEDLVEQGYAHKIKYDDLNNLDKRFFNRTIVNSDEFFCNEDLSETIKKHIVF